jgi:hypothetical protein
MTGGGVQFTGFPTVQLLLGQGQLTFTVQDTIAAPGTVAISLGSALPPGNEVPNDLITVLRSSARTLSIDGTGTASGTTLVFNAPAVGSPVTGALLEDAPSAGTGWSELTALGPINDVLFAHVKAADLNLGPDNTALTLNLSAGNFDAASNNAAPALAIQSSAGDDSFMVQQIASTTHITGGAGQDTVTAVVPGSPADPTLAQLNNLKLSGVQHLVVDNHTYSLGVDWSVAGGELSAGPSGGMTYDLLPIDGAASAQILSGSNLDTLTILPQSASVDATLAGNDVTLLAGKDVLAPTLNSFATYTQSNDRKATLGFAQLATTAKSYTEQGFRLTSSGSVVPDQTYGAAVGPGSPTDEFTLTASDGGPFTLNQVSLARSDTGTDPVTVIFSATVAGGGTLVQSFPVLPGQGFQQFTMPATFVNLTSVSWLPGPTLATGVQVVEQTSGIRFAGLPASLSASASPINLALNPNAVASESSVYTDPYGAYDASRAIDGNTDGNFGDGSVSHTLDLPNSWWQVALGAAYPLTSINIFNRSDYSGNRLSNFRVSVLLNGTEVFGQDFYTDPNANPNAVAAGGEVTVPLPAGIVGDTVKVQFVGPNGYNNAGNGYLSLAEVQVYGYPTTPFSLYGVSLSGNDGQPVTFTGTTADGQSVYQTFTPTPGAGFQAFQFPASFSSLTSVTWTPGTTLTTNIQAAPLVAPPTGLKRTVDLWLAATLDPLKIVFNTDGTHTSSTPTSTRTRHSTPILEGGSTGRL